MAAKYSGKIIWKGALNAPDPSQFSGMIGHDIENNIYYFSNGVSWLAITTWSDSYGSALQRPDGTLVSLTNQNVIDASNSKYGGFWNGTGNDSPALQAACLEAATFSPPRSVQLPPKVCLRDSVYVPSQVFIIGSDYIYGAVKTTITPHADVNLSTGFMLNFNTEDGINPVVQVYSRPFMCGLFGVFANNTNAIANIRLAVALGGTVIKNVYANKLRQIFKKPSGAYVDNVLIDGVHCAATDADNAEYQIELVGQGDALRILNLNFPTNITPRVAAKAISVSKSRGGNIDAMVNGTISLQECSAFSISNWHPELGQLLLNQSNCHVRDSWFAQLTDVPSPYYPIELTGRGSGGGSFELGLTNVDFVYGNGVFISDYAAEIRHDTEYTVRCHGARRVGMTVGDESTFSGIRMVTVAGAPIAEWNNHSHYLSQNGSFAGTHAIGSLNQWIESPYGGLLSPQAVSGYPSTLTAGTYYYRSQLILDAATASGRNPSYAEVSQVVTAGQAVRLSHQYLGNSTSAIIRIYRGTSAGVYDYYVDIPTINAEMFCDSGEHLSGCPWVSRSAGAMDSLSSEAGEFRVTPKSGPRGLASQEVTLSSDAAATIGSPLYAMSTVRMTAAITADRAFTINSSITQIGTQIKIVRTSAATGAFNINVNNPSASTLKALASAGTWCIVELDSTGAWRLTAYGSL